MNKNKLIGFTVALVILGLLAFAAYSLFEIQPASRIVLPSREARINEYLALDRWLLERGTPVRLEKSANLLQLNQADERQIFLQASLFRWTDEAVEYLIRWTEQGGTLFLVLDYSQGWIEKEPLILLEKFGIEAEIEGSRRILIHDLEYPNYDTRVSFSVKDETALALRDRGGRIRLVQQIAGRGKLIVTGSPLFLLSANLDSAPNARLALTLFAENDAWFFVRGETRVQGLFGSLFRQGNFTVLLVSVFVLIFIGFWAVIPGFGLVKGDDEKPGKALRERFLAEGTFLKKHGALELYREVYMKEIKKRLAHKEGLDEKEIQNRIFELLGRPIDYRDFLKTIKDYQTILERI